MRIFEGLQYASSISQMISTVIKLIKVKTK